MATLASHPIALDPKMQVRLYCDYVRETYAATEAMPLEVNAGYMIKTKKGRGGKTAYVLKHWDLSLIPRTQVTGRVGGRRIPEAPGPASLAYSKNPRSQ